MNRVFICLFVLAPSIALCEDRFTVLDETRIYDRATELTWEQAGSTDKVSFPEAEQYCRKLAKGSGLGWRLPKIKELATIIDENSYHPSIYPIFQTQSRFYWSSTRNAADNDFAWLVNFSDSHIHSFRLQTPYYVRCTYAVKASSQ